MRAEPQTFGESMRDGAWRIAAMSARLGLLLSAWFALTLSPIQRYYFSTYVGSSLHMIGSHEPDRAEWILKTRPKGKVEIADPQDLVPVPHGGLPFALSKLAQAQGWTGTDSTVPVAYPAGSQRLFLRQNFFDGRSLLALLLPPLELLALPLSVWFAFVYWRQQRDRERDPAWVWVHGETSWSADALQFSREMAEAAKFIVVKSWRGAQATLKKWRKGGSVSPSVEVMAEAPKLEKTEPKLLAVATVIPPKPPRKVRAAQPPASQPAQGELDLAAELPRAQTLPFRKLQNASSEEKWDKSKWID